MVENRKFQDCFCQEKILGMSYCEKRTRDGKWRATSQISLLIVGGLRYGQFVMLIDVP